MARSTWVLTLLSGKVRELLSFIKQTIQLRTCSLNLSERNIARGKFKVCLEYHLGNCKGPCEGLQAKEDYDEGLKQLKNFLKGRLGPVIQHFKNGMKIHAERMEFEKAEIVRKKIEFIENYQSKSIVVTPKLGDVDVFSVVKENDSAYVNYLMVQNGTIIQTKTLKVETHLDETTEEILSFSIAQLRTTFSSQAKEIILPFIIDYDEPDITMTVPKGGDKKKLLDLSERNVNYFIQDLKQKQRLKLEGKEHG
jgi:excinuclease ABC subunit C